MTPDEFVGSSLAGLGDALDVKYGLDLRRALQDDAQRKHAAQVERELSLKSGNDLALANVREAGDDRRSAARIAGDRDIEGLRSKAAMERLIAGNKDLFDRMDANEQIKTALEYKHLGASPRKTLPDGTLEPMAAYLDRAHDELVGQAHAGLSLKEQGLAAHDAKIRAAADAQQAIFHNEEARIARVAAVKARQVLMAELEAGHRSLLPNKPGVNKALELIQGRPDADPGQLLARTAEQMEDKDTKKALLNFAKTYTDSLADSETAEKNSPSHALLQDRVNSFEKQIHQLMDQRKSMTTAYDHEAGTPFGLKALQRRLSNSLVLPDGSATDGKAASDIFRSGGSSVAPLNFEAESFDESGGGDIAPPQASSLFLPPATGRNSVMSLPLAKPPAEVLPWSLTQPDILPRAPGVNSLSLPPSQLLRWQAPASGVNQFVLP